MRAILGVVAAATMVAGCSQYGDGYGAGPRDLGYGRYDYDRPDPQYGRYEADR